MGFKIIITKHSVEKIGIKAWNITLNMILIDNSIEIINKNYRVRCIDNEKINTKIPLFINMMEKDINSYVDTQIIFNEDSLNSAVDIISLQLSTKWGINYDNSTK